MNNTPQADSKDQGSFLTGFGLGLFAGAAGYFLFTTDRGKKVQSELTQEWAAAKKNLKDSPASEATAGVNLKQMIIETASSFLELDQVKSATSKKDKKDSKPTKKTKPSKSTKTNSKKFTGV